MTIENATIEMYCGNYLKLQCSVVDVDNASVALDLTGLTVKWALSKGTLSSYKKTPVLEKTVGSGITVTDAVNGLVEIVMLTADTTAFKPGDYYWELELTDGSSQRHVVAVGGITMKLNVENT